LFCIFILIGCSLSYAGCKSEIKIKDKCFDRHDIRYDTCYSIVTGKKLSRADSIEYKGKYKDTMTIELYILGKDTTVLVNENPPPPPGTY